MDAARLDGIAEDLVALLGSGRQRGALADIDMAGAYVVAERVRVLRGARGERPVGRKIGFTNTTIWERYGVDGPMWSHVYDTTVRDAPEGRAELSVAGLPEPRVEPEIVLGLGRAPAPGMDEAALMDCVHWIAHGFEVVQSVFPGWRMTGPEAAAAFGLHGALVVGPRRAVADDRPAWAAALRGFAVTLLCDGAAVDRGAARNVLGGPLSALRFAVEEIDRRGQPPLAAGEIVTTGTLTDAHPAVPGQSWTAAFAGLDVAPLTLRIVAPAEG